MPSHLSRRQLLQRAGALGAFAAMVETPRWRSCSAHRA
ncbi:twin-arginine translocation signal domain-containing protein [Pseudomonas aeruginosa]